MAYPAAPPITALTTEVKTRRHMSAGIGMDRENQNIHLSYLPS
jgi:hypothetical protein